MGACCAPRRLRRTHLIRTRASRDPVCRLSLRERLRRCLSVAVFILRPRVTGSIPWSSRMTHHVRLHYRAVSPTAELEASLPSLSSLVGIPSPTVPKYTLEISRKYSIYSSIQSGQLKINEQKHTLHSRDTTCVSRRGGPRTHSGAPLHEMRGLRKAQYGQSSTRSVSALTRIEFGRYTPPTRGCTGELAY